MTYRNEVFDENIERVLDPKNSPLQPAVYVRQKLESERRKLEIQNEQMKDPYKPRLPEVEKFAKPTSPPQQPSARMDPN